MGGEGVAGDGGAEKVSLGVIAPVIAIPNFILRDDGVCRLSPQLARVVATVIKSQTQIETGMIQG